MNLNRDFSQFLADQREIIQNGRDEALAQQDSLERMRLSAIRQGRIKDADSIASFLQTTIKELNFFREASKIRAEKPRFDISSLKDWLHRPPTPDSFSRVNGTISTKRPFACFEGVFQETENKTSGHLMGPFFIAVAANFSNAVNILPGNLVCVFSRSANPSANQSVELRIWPMDRIGEYFKGKSFEDASLALPPDSNETILSLHRGEMPQLFQIAVENMVRAALSKNPPPKVAEGFMTLLEQYGSTEQKTLQP